MDYERVYGELIERCRQRGWTKKDAPCYTERHHIVPKSMGGGDEKENLVCLTAREHFIAHHLLCKIHKNRKMAYALFRVCHNEVGDRLTSKEYDRAKSIYNLFNSGKNSVWYGRKHSKETKDLMKRSHFELKNKIVVCPWCNSKVSFLTRFASHFHNCRLHPDCTDEIRRKYGVKVDGEIYHIVKMIDSGVAVHDDIKEELGCSNDQISKARRVVEKFVGKPVVLTKRKDAKDDKYGIKTSTKKYMAIVRLLDGKTVDEVMLEVDCSRSVIDNALHLIRKKDKEDFVPKEKCNIDNYGFKLGTKKSLVSRLILNGALDIKEIIKDASCSQSSVRDVKRAMESIDGVERKLFNWDR